MSGSRIYMDWNATAPLLPEAREALLFALDQLGNPSSVHGEGRAVRALVETPDAMLPLSAARNPQRSSLPAARRKRRTRR